MTCPYYNESKENMLDGIYCDKIDGRPGVRFWGHYCKSNNKDCPYMGGSDPYEDDYELACARKQKREADKKLKDAQESYKREQERANVTASYTSKSSTSDSYSSSSSYSSGGGSGADIILVPILGIAIDLMSLPSWNRSLAWLSFVVISGLYVFNDFKAAASLFDISLYPLSIFAIALSCTILRIFRFPVDFFSYKGYSIFTIIFSLILVLGLGGAIYLTWIQFSFQFLWELFLAYAMIPCVILAVSILIMRVKNQYPIVFYLFLLLFAYCIYVYIKDLF